jgi:serine/threonine protein kinase
LNNNIVVESEKFNLIKEAISMTCYKHPNLIKFYGICIENGTFFPKYLVLEYMNCGDLLQYLRKARTNNKLDFKTAIKISIDIASGCDFLQQMKMIHRDIAARNCLVASSSDSQTKIIVKIGDFGLARGLYMNDYYRHDDKRLLPIRWMSPESLKDGVYTAQSDVW